MLILLFIYLFVGVWLLHLAIFLHFLFAFRSLNFRRKKNPRARKHLSVQLFEQMIVPNADMRVQDISITEYESVAGIAGGIELSEKLWGKNIEKYIYLCVEVKCCWCWCWCCCFWMKLSAQMHAHGRSIVCHSNTLKKLWIRICNFTAYLASQSRATLLFICCCCSCHLCFFRSGIASLLFAYVAAVDEPFLADKSECQRNRRKTTSNTTKSWRRYKDIVLACHRIRRWRWRCRSVVCVFVCLCVLELKISVYRFFFILLISLNGSSNWCNFLFCIVVGTHTEG